MTSATMQHATKAAMVEDVVEFYRCFLNRNHLSGHLKRFEDRLNADPKAAEAEAVVFSWLRAERLSPDIFEDNSKGGPDFQCNGTNGFLVEVTSLDSESVSRKSGFPLKITDSGGQAYSLITGKLYSAVQGKAKQLGGQSLPTVLAITSAYDYSGLLMDQMAARNLLIGDPYFSVPMGPNAGPAQSVTSLKNAAFVRSSLVDVAGNPTFTPCYQSVSAVLLISIYPRNLDVVGVVHPEPARRFDPQQLSGIPFIRFKQWPIVGGKIEPEWIQCGELKDHPARFSNKRHLT